MKFPCSTGEAAVVLSTNELRLADLVRRGKIQPRPPMWAGRRQWHATHVFQAAKELGVLTPELEARIVPDEEVDQ